MAQTRRPLFLVDRYSMGMLHLTPSHRSPRIVGSTNVESRSPQGHAAMALPPERPRPKFVQCTKPTTPSTCLGFLPRALAGVVLGASLGLTGCGVGQGPLSEAEFKEALASNGDQAKVVEALFADPEFKAMWRYVADCPTDRPKNLGPVTLKTFDRVGRDGVPFFGTWSESTRTLSINPDHPANEDNPQELVDTTTHELIHAINDLEYQCTQAGAPPSPLGQVGEASTPRVATVRGTPADAEHLRDVGPAASEACTEYLDLNAEAQSLIARIVRRNIQTTGIGRPTLTFGNLAMREDPAKLQAFQACRDQACSLPDADDRREGVAECQAAAVPPLQR
jgi:hypothetical protein